MSAAFVWGETLSVWSLHPDPIKLTLSSSSPRTMATTPSVTLYTIVNTARAIAIWV